MPELKSVTLAGTDITTTSLGFGCNDLLGNKTREQGLRLLGTAYDSGVLHFDVARKYNFGEAETLVGLFSQGRRDKITITTKFGMQPPGKLAQNKGLVQVLRAAIRASPMLRKIAKRGAKTITQKRQFDISSAQASLEKSLAELRTDYIDLLLLHECEPVDCAPELLQFLQNAKRVGKIRAFGVGTHVTATQTIFENSPGFAEVVQFKNTILDPGPTELVGAKSIIVHGAVSELEIVRKRLETDLDFSRNMKDCFGIDSAQNSCLANLLLQYALYRNPNGIVLFRSANPDRITANVKAATEAAFSPASLARYAAVVANGRQQVD